MFCPLERAVRITPPPRAPGKEPVHKYEGFYAWWLEPCPPPTTSPVQCGTAAAIVGNHSAGGRAAAAAAARRRTLYLRVGLVVGHLEQRPRPVAVPQRAHELRHRDGVGVVTHEPHDEDAILTQVVVDERGRDLLVLVALDPIHETQVFADVAMAVGPEGETQDPGHEAEACQDADEDHPEPNEEVNLLVEQVDGEHALHGVPLHVPETPHLEVAHGDARKPRRLSPVDAVPHRVQHLDTVQVEVLPQERVQ